MADLKISQLTSATTPLDGTELVPVVQGGVTKKVTAEAVAATTQPSGTANGVAYLNGSKVLTTGSALTFDGTNLAVNSAGIDWKFGGTVYANATISGLDYIFTTSNGAVPIINSGASVHIWRNAGNEGMRLTSTGLGIGTSSPVTALDVASSASDAVASLTAIGVQRWQLKTERSTGNFLVYNQTGASTPITLTTSGNLGIGTSSPGYKLHVQSATPVVAIQDTTSAAGGVGGTLNFIAYTSGTSGANIEAQIKGVKSSANAAGELQFFTSDSTGTSTQRAIIDGSGNYLIGLTSATGVAKLQVSGPLRTTGYTVATLPAGTVGMRTYVTDALAPSFGATVVAGGAVTIPVFYNGTNWIVG